MMNMTQRNNFTPSKFQEDIFYSILNDSGNLVISAVAGSGKTTTLLKSLEIIPDDKSVLFLAFNGSIADELGKRIPKDKTNVTVSTVHSFGMKNIIKRFYPNVDTKKYRGILQSIIQFKTGKNLTEIKSYNFNDEQKEWVNEIFKLIPPNITEKKDFIKNVLELCNLGRLNLVDFNIKSIGLIEINKIATKFSIDNLDNESTIAWFLSKIGLQYHEKIDFTDMVSLPIILDIEINKYDLVFIDESQDLNTCQRTLMMRAINENGGRFIAVGDPKQAIYAFAGADHESYQKLKTIPNTVELPLSYTYRVAPEIVNMVKHLNPSIIPHPKNAPGKVYDEFSYKDIKDGDMVLCRNTFPLVSLCIKLLTEGKKSYVVGSDIGESLITMINTTNKNNIEFNMDNVISSLMIEKENLIEKIIGNHNISRSEAMNEPKIVLFGEKIQQIEALSYGIDDPQVVINKIETIFSDDKKEGIRLSTIHKSKGLESERVFIIHEDLLPSKYAKQPWEIEQEKNLEYVAYTRAKTTLGFVNDFDAFETHKKREIKNGGVKLSKHVGSINGKKRLQLKVINIKTFKGKFGPGTITELVDKDGNVFSLFKEIDTGFLKGKKMGRKVEIGSEVEFMAIIKEHKEFNGVKTTTIGSLTHF
jgi:DNA helicase II / ATP-dependent DNA helicase PcrA